MLTYEDILPLVKRGTANMANAYFVLFDYQW